MATAVCKVEIPNVEGLRENELTVGRDFLLNCEGEFPRDLAQDKLQFVFPPEQKHYLKVRHFEFRSATTADIKVTSYVAAQYQIPNLQLTDGTVTVDLGQINFDVQTVLPSPQAQGAEAGKKPEPYGPMGPAEIGVPQFYFVIAGAIAAVFVLAICYKIYRVIQRRRLLERLRQHDSAQSPLHQFYASQRRLQRYNTVFFGGEASKEEIADGVAELQRMFRLYLTRKFKVPAMEWGPRLVTKELKSYHHKAFAEYGIETQKLLTEFIKAQKDANKVKTSDVINLNKRVRVLIEGLEQLS